ncbi:hypothetical protein JNUCC83_08385 [Vagococcus sp. JNUCC 83]
MKILFFRTSEKLSELTSGKLNRVISNDGEWINCLNDSDLPILGALISSNELDDEVNPLFEGEKENPFNFNRAAKSIFITHLSNIWESESSVEYAQLALEGVESYETKFNKSLLLFSEEEIIQTINGLGDRFSFYGLKFRIKIYKDYHNFYSREYGLMVKENLWAKYQTTKNLSMILSVDEKKKNLTRDDLISLFNTMINPQQGIIPLLIFEGITLSRIDESDELRHLLKNDVDTESICIKSCTDKLDNRGFNLSIDRTLELDQEVMKCIDRAANSENMIRINRHEFEYLNLVETPYLLRSAEGRRDKLNSPSGTLSYGGTINRIKECRRQMESINPEIDDFSTRYIANCGKSHYINKFMKNGLSETEAIIKTLKRFGEWNSNGIFEEEVKLDTNKIRIARLRRIYTMYE